MVTGQLERTDSCYVLLPHLFVTRAEAAAACEVVQSGSTLPSIHSHAQNEFVMDTAVNKEYGDIWLGLQRVNASSFAWQDGSPVEYVAWFGDEPNDTGDCVYMSFLWSQWRDINCDTAHFFVVCQYKPQ
ncbi:snaclec 6-like [Pollicipes pollicipes]|uniref:snaclec 6-like n=1 Tax=Pollicipes pollicipes TaxID=41117 RepID=UPI001884FC13|nr:snaclec 6-like [Pollicipes pollicipes]